MTGGRRGALLGVVAALLLTAPAAAQTTIPIHDVQGPGASSPIVGSTVTVDGVVTAVTSDGFFLQEEDAIVDADPATSEGVFVFTSAAAGPPVGLSHVATTRMFAVATSTVAARKACAQRST